MSRRSQIRMTEGEAALFLASQRTVICATNGREGWPHLMPLWYVLRTPAAEEGGRSRPELWSWTYAASQKVRNLERDARATLQVEDGVEYHLLRGVMLKTEVVIHRELEAVAGVGLDIFTRYAAAASAPSPAAAEASPSSSSVQGEAPERLPEEVREMVLRQAPKRVALQFVERERATWDHRKLGSVY